MTTVGYGDISGTNNLERVVSMIIMIVRYTIWDTFDEKLK